MYDKDERWTATQVLKHPYFKEIRDQDKTLNQHLVAGT